MKNEINITNNHNIKVHKLIDKEYLILIGINLFSFLLFLFLTIFIPGFILFALFMGFGTIVFSIFSWLYSARKKLKKVYYLNKANDNNYYWVEVWHKKDDIDENTIDPSLLWNIQGKLTPVIDNTDKNPKPFNPHLEPISHYNPSSIDVARTLEHSASSRMLKVKEKGVKEQLKLLIVVGAFLGMGYLCIVLLESTGW